MLLVLAMVGTAKADVEWSIWEGTNTDNVYIPKGLIASMEVGDTIIVSFSQTNDGKDGEIDIDWKTIVYSGMGEDYSNYFDYTNNIVTINITETLKNQVAGSASYTEYYYDSEWKTRETTAGGDLRIKANGSLQFSSIILKKNKSFIVKSYDVSATITSWSGGTNVSPSGLTSDDYLYFNATIDGSKSNWQAQLGDLGTIGVVGGFWFPVTTYYSTLNASGAYLNGNYINVTGMKQYHPVSSFSIGSIGYATFSADQQVTAPNTVTAYKATVNGSSVTLTPFTNNVIPANTGAIIAGNEGAVLEFTASSESTIETSDLIACTTATDVTTLAESGYNLYVLYPGTGESETELSLSTLLENFGGWNSSITWNSSTYTATYTEQTGNGEGGWVGANWSAYDKLKLNFSSNTLDADATFYVAYNGHNEATTQATLSQGSTSSIEIELNSDYKGAIGNFSMYSNATSGSVTFESAALIDNDGATVAEFRKTSSGTLAANKAYLKISSSPASPAPSLSISFDGMGNTTGISNVQKTVVEDNRIYNLNGQEVKNAGKGIFIKNGKKYIIK